MKPYEHLNGKEIVYKNSRSSHSGTVCIINIDYDIGVSLTAKHDSSLCLLSIYGPGSPKAKEIPSHKFEVYPALFDIEIDHLSKEVYDAEVVNWQESVAFNSPGFKPGYKPICQFSL